MSKKHAVFTSALAIVLACSGCGSIRFGSISVGSGSRNTLMKMSEEDLTTTEGKLYLEAWNAKYKSEFAQDANLLVAQDDSAAAGFVQNAFLVGRAQIADGKTVPETVAQKFADAAEAYSSTHDGVDTGTVVQAYTCLYLADQEYNSFLASDAVTVSDEESRVVYVRQIYLPYTDDASRAEQKKKMDQIQSNLTQKYVYFKQQAALYSESEDILRKIKAGELSEELQNAVFSLSNGQTTGILEEGNAYWMFQCVDSNLEPDRTEYASDLKREKAQQLYRDEADSYAQAQSAEWNSAAWETMTTVSDDGVEEAAAADTSFYEGYINALS